MGKIGREQGWKILLISILILMLGYGIGRIYGMSVYPDEFGYWASAAAMVGWDWSQVASLGAYYSFGYSAILYPILVFTSNSVTAYRIAVGINFIFMITALILMWEIGRRLGAKKEFSVAFAGITVLYPAWLLYGQMTLTEAMLMFMVILLVYLWMRYLEKPDVFRGLVLVAAALYTYSLHLRALGILIACGLTILIWGLCNPKTRKKILVLFVYGIAAIVLLFAVKEVIQQSVYTGADASMLQANDFGGQIDKIKSIFTPIGLRNFTVNMAGKLLYMGFATGGLAYWGIYRCIDKIWKLILAIRNGHKQNMEGWVSVLVVLMVLGQLMVCGIYTIGSFEPDWMIYGRYIEAIIPVLILFGGYGLYECGNTLPLQSLFLIIQSLAAGICLLACRNMGISHIRGEHSVMTSILIGDGNLEPILFFVNVWLIGSLSSIGMVFLINKIRCENRKNWLWLLWIPVVIEVIVAVRISQLHVYTSNQNMRTDLAVVEVLDGPDYKDKDIVFLQEGEQKWIGFLQMQFRDRQIRLIKETDLQELETEDLDNTVLLAYYNSEHLKELEKWYPHRATADVYYMYYR